MTLTTSLPGTKYYQAVSGDSCEVISNKFGTFTVTQFQSWNPVGPDCGQLFLGYYYCIAVPGTPTTRSTTSTIQTTSATSSGPSPTQTGIIATCTKYYKTVSGDSCQAISDRLGTFTVTQFISWNPAVQNDCSQLYLGYYYCIAIPGTPTTRTTTSTTQATSTTSTVSPTQTGIISSCTKYYKTVSGDTCQVISDRLGTFSVAQFISWNPAVQSDCSQLYLGYYYCVAIPGTPTTRTTTSTTSRDPTPTPTGPQPQQPGIVSNCNKYYLVKSGDSCYTIQQTQAVTEVDFLRWNAGVKADCSNLFVGYYVCTGVA